MDKLSLYELLSFAIPGYLVLAVGNAYVVIFSGTPFISNVQIGEGLLIFCLSVFTGVLVHILTFWLIRRFNWYRRIIYPDFQQLRLSEYTLRILPFVEVEYNKIKEHEAERKNKIPEYLFDFAYYYLETNGKITQAKNFQSLYFWFRNIFTICICLTPVSLVIWIYACFADFAGIQKIEMFGMFGGSIIIALVCIPAARWLRAKLFDRILGSYYSDIVHVSK